MRLIDADTLVAAYDAAHDGPPGKARTLILNAPTVDAEPVRIGFWWYNPDSYGYACGLCNERSMDESRYCPNCGARMSDPTRTWHPGGHNA